MLPQCTDLQFTTFHESSTGQKINDCPPDTAIGVVSVTVNAPLHFHFFTTQAPLFTLVPSVGEPVRFGFDVLSNLVTLDTSVRTGGNYGVVVRSSNITQSVGFFLSG